MRLKALALVAAMLLPTGCSSWNPLVAMGFQSEPTNKPTPLAPITATANPRAAWTAQVGKSDRYIFRPDIQDGLVYAAAADGTVTVLDANTGRVTAKAETKKRFSGGLDVGDNKIVIGTLKGEVVALDLAGKPLWTVTVAGEVIAPPEIAGKVVIVRTADGRIFGLSTEDGKRLWVFQRPMPALLLRSEAGVLAIGKDVVAGYPNGKLIALDLEDGKLTWEVNVSLPRGTTELERIADVAGLPIIDGGTVCAASYQGKVACFDIQSRNLLWSRDISSSRGLAVDAKRIFVVDDNGAVHALDKTSGASIWKQDKLLYRRVATPVVLDDRVVVGDGFGFLHIISPEDGSIVGRMASDGSAVQWMIPSPWGVIAQTAKGSVSLVKY